MYIFNILYFPTIFYHIVVTLNNEKEKNEMYFYQNITYGINFTKHLLSPGREIR